MNNRSICQQTIASFVSATQITSQIARFMGPSCGLPGSCRPQVGPILAHEPCYQGSYCPTQLFWPHLIGWRTRSWFKNGDVWLTCLSLHWHWLGQDSVSNHQLHDCLLNHLFRRRLKNISKLRVTGLCVGNSPETGEFPAQMASNAENISIWWRHHVLKPRKQMFLDLGISLPPASRKLANFSL